jgi:hypothetical protein
MLDEVHTTAYKIFLFQMFIWNKSADLSSHKIQSKKNSPINRNYEKIESINIQVQN